MTKQCLICESEIEVDEISVSHATIWSSHGNFGSAVYDPADPGVFLEALFCDACLLRKKLLVEEVIARTRHEVIARRSADL